MLIIAALAGCSSGSVSDGVSPGSSGAGGRDVTSPSAKTVSDVLEQRIAEEDNAEGAGAETDQAEILVPFDETDPAIFDFGDEPLRQSGVNEGAPEPEDVSEIEELMSSTEGVDVDLTVLSSIMVYSQVFDMIDGPDRYLGKTVKMTGMYSDYYDEANDIFYAACIIQDATACCSQGIEFVLSDEYSYPEDYPEYGDTVTVVGEFDTYIDGGYVYCTLKNSELLDES